jgi:hypothetical protein
LSGRWDGSRGGEPPELATPAWMGSRFVRVQDYLEALPSGLASYPGCQARAGLAQTFVAAAPRGREHLDPVVAELGRAPVRGWVPEVGFLATLLAVGDAAGMTDAQLLAWNRETNRALYRGIFLRALMALFSPAALVERAPARWSALHQGTSLSVNLDGPGRAIGVLAFPPRLYTPLLLQVYAGAFAAGFEHARGRDVTVELAEAREREARFLATWR